MTAEDYLPDRRTITALREAVQGCRGCSLWKGTTQAVFGEGPLSARVIMVGEQPGDQEDRRGRPFVGPAGRELDEALEAAGIDRRDAYITNAVKHFKFTPRGKRRIHKRPAAEELAACRPWLEAELEVVRPRALVGLGATAAQALFGRTVRVTRDRGKPIDTDLAPVGMVTVHPSSILRAPDDRARQEERELFRKDMVTLARLLDTSSR
jgi:uracil-DNA glycosylase family protein